MIPVYDEDGKLIGQVTKLDEEEGLATVELNDEVMLVKLGMHGLPPDMSIGFTSGGVVEKGKDEDDPRAD